MHVFTLFGRAVVWLFLCMLSASATKAAQLVNETFSAGKAGWTNDGTWIVQGTNQYLRGIFSAQTVPFPEASSWIANQNSSSGAFSGDYTSVDAQMVGFSFYAEQVLPSELQIRLTGQSNAFVRSLSGILAATGMWHHIDISLESTSAGGWQGGDDLAFQDMLKNVQKLEVQLFRFGPVIQRYRLDNVYIGRRPAIGSINATTNWVTIDLSDLQPNRTYRLQAASYPGFNWLDIGNPLTATSQAYSVTILGNQDPYRQFRFTR